MIQDDAKRLLEKIGVPFDAAHREQIFGKVDQFAAAGDNKAKLMGAMIKAYLEREWEFNRTPDLATLQKFVSGDFKIGLLSSFDTPPDKWYTPAVAPPDEELVKQRWSGDIPEKFAAGNLTGDYLKAVQEDLPEARADFLRDAEKKHFLAFADGLRNMFMLYHLTSDVLERREGFGKEGDRMARTMAVLLFDDESYPKPEKKSQMDSTLGFEVSGGNYCTLRGQEHLAKYIRESGYNPFEGLSVAEVGGIKHYEDARNFNDNYFTITLPETPVMGLLGRYQNSGGTNFTNVGGDKIVSLSSHEKHYGKEKYDYFVSNMVISRGSGMGFDIGRLDYNNPEGLRLSRELVAIGNNILRPGGASLHFGADLMSEVLRTPIWEEREERGQKVRYSSRSNDLLKFMGANLTKNVADNYVITHDDTRGMTKESLEAFKAGKTWEEFSGIPTPFAEQVGGKQSPAQRGDKSSRSRRPRDE